MQAGTVLIVLVALIAVAMIVQALVLAVFVLGIQRRYDRTEALLSQISHDILPVLASARELLTESKEKVTLISAAVLEITAIAKAQVTRLDELLTEASDRARLQLVRLDDLVSDTVGRVEETTQAIQKSVLGPIREITAILVGVRTSLDFLLRRNRRSVERVTQDEELFI
jgi:hypothetical protein